MGNPKLLRLPPLSIRRTFLRYGNTNMIVSETQMSHITCSSMLLAKYCSTTMSAGLDMILRVFKRQIGSSGSPAFSRAIGYVESGKPVPQLWLVSWTSDSQAYTWNILSKHVSIYYFSCYNAAKPTAMLCEYLQT